MVGGKFSVVWCLIILCVLVKVTESGECCRTRYGIMGNVMNERWCDNYCCFHGNVYSCCNNWFFRAPDRDRSTFCANWFTRHIWVPIIVALVIIGLLIGCGVCCCCMCC
ncbi:uncharacterized protein [Argopecten irradians]|uniref:uncharacterized protein n=1 Tax=Argopecten irradians TaxID=31199 RepID=UPI003718E9DF